MNTPRSAGHCHFHCCCLHHETRRQTFHPNRSDFYPPLYYLIPRNDLCACHSFSPSIFRQPYTIPQPCNRSIRPCHSRARKERSIDLELPSSETAVKSDQSTTDRDQQCRIIDVRDITPLDADQQRIPSLLCKKMIFTSDDIHVSSTSVLINQDGQEILSTSIAEEDRRREEEVIDVSSELKRIDSVSSSSSRTSTKASHEQLALQTESSLFDSHNRSMLVSSPDRSVGPRIGTPSTENSPPKESQVPQLPASSPPDINKIKSNEALRYSTRSIRSITASNNQRIKSVTDVQPSDLPLRTTRSTLDYGLLIDDTHTITTKRI